jgi:hypothetical protein
MRKLLPLGLLAALLVPTTAHSARPVGDLREALVAWAAGDEARALAVLRAVDESAANTRATNSLRRAKLLMARGLAHQQPLATLAFARLEERAYLVYAAERRSTLSAASRALLPELVAIAAAARPRSAPRDLSAMVLSSVGGHLHRAHQESGAAGFYQQALAFDAGQPAALLGLAALHEQRGEYAAAAKLLAALLRAAGEHREARLRYAINLARLDRATEAELLLRELAGAGGDWIRSLAAQELARLFERRGDHAGASALLASATAALPCDPVLPVQAALAAERSGAAQPLDLATLADCGDAVESARARYARAPTAELQALRQRLAAADPEWREALRRALSRVR